MNNSAVILKQKQKGFTLVELLIVVIILAILAAIVVPQFTASTDDANDAALASNLANIRAAIDLYYQQHGEYPSKEQASGGTCAGTTAGTGAADSAAAFISQLTLYTDANGLACSSKISSGTTETYTYGPYLQKGELPNNPETGSNTLTIVTTGDLNLEGTAKPATGMGWRFDNKSGKFIADHEDLEDL